ncbi:MAG: Do family serine endopeptidase [Candidatus Omnitrophica bacterium]|nr:Do family serine endopeptidase [Candidatus Omnitrophota bacterium]
MFNWVKQHKISSLALMLVIGVIIGLGIAARFNLPSRSNAASPEEKSIKTIAVTGEIDIQNAFIRVADEVGPAVVSIVTETTQKVPGQRFYFGPPKEFLGPNADNEQFNKFFKDFFGDMPEREFKQQGLGSGVIIDKEGYIITNDHVVGAATKITAILPDGRRFNGEIKGSDPRSDLAVIKINAKDLPVAKLGDSDSLKTGQWVVAIGNPFGIAVNNPKPTVTVGVISALHRSLPLGGVQGRNYIDLIQTDAAINPGNSGGPLCDLDGNIIGLNVAIYSTTGGYQGIGFAVPVDTLKNVLGDLIEGRKVLYGWLGVTVQEISQEMAEYFKITDRKGVIVVDAVKDGPADKSGIKSEDIIRTFNGKEIDSVQTLLKFVGEAKVNQKAQIGILRDGKEATVNLVIGERPAEEVLAKGETGKTETGEALTGTNWRGLTVTDITDEISQRYNIEKQEGVLITAVEENSPASDAGLMAGLVIKEINKTAMKNVAEYNKIVQNAKGNVLVRTNKGFVILKEPEKKE